ncbi:MAG: hypothetical protein EXR62_06490 [Chloroflexi bacterium]|nr:hypothetical protein [Chloroflexota bacterium]
MSNWFYEAHHPPLYYTLGAAATFWIDTSDYREPRLNLFGYSGTGLGGFNVITHDQDESFPYHGILLALHLVHLISVLLSTLLAVIDKEGKPVTAILGCFKLAPPSFYLCRRESGSPLGILAGRRNCLAIY